MLSHAQAVPLMHHGVHVHCASPPLPELPSYSRGVFGVCAVLHGILSAIADTGAPMGRRTLIN